ncbi:MAG: hypothetical protein Q4F69_10610 [Bacteroidia bacterium]|nr:hypothetical protein [Bacteroidia bacterium]
MKYHVGNEITDYLKDHGISQAWLARKVNYDPGNFNRMLRKPSMDMEFLLKISVSLNHNFGAKFCEYIEYVIAETGKPAE